MVFMLTSNLLVCYRRDRKCLRRLMLMSPVHWQLTKFLLWMMYYVKNTRDLGPPPWSTKRVSLFYNVHVYSFIAPDKALFCSTKMYWASVQQNLQKTLCDQQSLRSACTSAQYGMGSHFSLFGCRRYMQSGKGKTQIRLRGCAGWSESLMVAQVLF